MGVFYSVTTEMLIKLEKNSVQFTLLSDGSGIAL